MKALEFPTTCLISVQDLSYLAPRVQPMQANATFNPFQLLKTIIVILL